ncbi:site-specific DNA-methyltransferase [Campylobacter fetus]|uniref:site-specific DNA-methyltransferase n=1 Tax=Campylobacter fetus TaxID=196 RepID=UPI000412D19F|nr:hypothetical protein CFTD6783_07495 [Campylobacter fetus subsp. testudinum]OCS11285.1 hypothetical protein CFTD6690_07125 [Campylobacter fetus subsp. testudinum]
MDSNELLNDIECKFKTLLNAKSLAISNDSKILSFLLTESKFKNEYKDMFFEIHKSNEQNIAIFKQNAFFEFLDTRVLGNSYTAYSNKIGLTNAINKFIKSNEQVVLSFPFKDGVIKGSQSKDEDKTNEIFFNNILDKSEIDVLFAKKALYNFELISADEQNLQDILANGGGWSITYSSKAITF